MRKKADFYSLKAKKANYPARSVFKLEQINKKHKLLTKCTKILELGAAPGSWTKWLLANSSAKIYALDKMDLKISANTRLNFIKADFFEYDFLEQLKDELPFDLILSDMAPSTTGIKSVDQEQSYAIVDELLAIAQNCLKTDGHLLAKNFQGQKTNLLQKKFKDSFTQVVIIKPDSSKKESFEVFLLGKNKLTHKH